MVYTPKRSLLLTALPYSLLPVCLLACFPGCDAPSANQPVANTQAPATLPADEFASGANSGESVSSQALTGADQPGELARASPESSVPLRAASSVSENAKVTGQPLGTRAGSVPGPLDSQSLPPSVEQLVADMKALYANAKMYTDSGRVSEKRGASVSTAEFGTRWTRDTGAFSLTYRTVDRTYTISRSAAGETAVDDSAGSGPEPRKSLESTMRVARRLTKGTTEIVPALLLPTELGESGFWSAASNFSQSRAEAVGGVRCSVVRGDYYGADGDIELWLDEQLAIRQIRVTEKRLGRTTTWTMAPVLKK